jgi:hypothetical protein
MTMAPFKSERGPAHFAKTRDHLPAVDFCADRRIGRPLFLDRRGSRKLADGGSLTSSAGLLPPPSAHPEALIRVFGARTVRWRSIFAVHTWIVIKEHGAATYSRYDYAAWGEPIRSNGFAADARWFGATPEAVVAVDGQEASRLKGVGKCRNFRRRIGVVSGESALVG